MRGLVSLEEAFGALQAAHAAGENVRALGRAIGVAHTTVAQWLRAGRPGREQAQRDALRRWATAWQGAEAAAVVPETPPPPPAGPAGAVRVVEDASLELIELAGRLAAAARSLRGKT